MRCMKRLRNVRFKGENLIGKSFISNAKDVLKFQSFVLEKTLGLGAVLKHSTKIRKNRGAKDHNGSDSRTV